MVILRFIFGFNDHPQQGSKGDPQIKKQGLITFKIYLQVYVPAVN